MPKNSSTEDRLAAHLAADADHGTSPKTSRSRRRPTEYNGPYFRQPRQLLKGFVGSIFHYDKVDLAPDKYSMFAEMLPGARTWEIDSGGVKEQGEFDYIVNLKFVSDESNSFEILQTGGAVNSDGVLSRLTELV